MTLLTLCEGFVTIKAFPARPSMQQHNASYNTVQITLQDRSQINSYHNSWRYSITSHLWLNTPTSCDSVPPPSSLYPAVMQWKSVSIWSQKSTLSLKRFSPRPFVYLTDIIARFGESRSDTRHTKKNFRSQSSERVSGTYMNLLACSSYTV